MRIKSAFSATFYRHIQGSYLWPLDALRSGNAQSRLLPETSAMFNRWKTHFIQMFKQACLILRSILVEIIISDAVNARLVV